MNNIKFVVFDFDGVFTDGKFYFDNENNIKKSYNGKDSYALKLLKKYNIKSGVITNDTVISIKHAPHIFNRLDKVSLGVNRPKLDILNEWIQEYNFTYDEIAYIGDDLPDIPVLKKVGFAACPFDAMDEVKKICQYICKNKGGECAVREFVDLIINQINKNKSININNAGKITAVIPVKKNSTRCKNKNIRQFGDINLLQLKIQTLKKVKGIDQILVTSNCDKMLKIAQQLGVRTHKRSEKYCAKCPPSVLFPFLASLLSTPIMMYVQVTTPFVSHITYDNIIETWHKEKNNIDSFVTCNTIQEFIWYKNKPINYEITQHPMSQNLPKYNTLNFACHILNTDTIRKYNNIIGVKPYFYKLDNIENMDIDYNNQFLISELLYNQNITNNLICNTIMHHKNEKMELLDCTIRDGGYLNNWNFTNEQIIDCYKAVTDAGYDYFEIGYKRKKNKNDKINGKWYYLEDKYIDDILNKFKGCKIAVMIEPLKNDIDIDDFVHRDKSNISLIRVLTKNDADQKHIIKICKQLIDYGYDVTLNISYSNMISDNDIIKFVADYHNLNLKAIYLADSYGGFNIINIPSQLHKFYIELNKYNSNISFGFHCHNNNENALSKTNMAIFHGCSMIDSCIGGLGRGAGNLKSEQLLSYLHKNNPDYIKIITPLILYYDKYILSKKQYNNCPYIRTHPYYIISGTLSVHPNYISEIFKNKTNVKQDLELIIKIYEYTKTSNKNYNNQLITSLLK